MGTKAFFDLVLPVKGTKIIALAVPAEHGGVWFKYKSYPTAEEAASAAQYFDQNDETVYFAVNTFGDWYYDKAKGKKRIRTQENVVSCRSLFDDFDVDADDAKKYATRDDALRDVIKLAKAIHLTPTITSSGGGYHCYFSADEDFDVDVWLRLSAMKRDVAAHLGLKTDRAVDMDSARILRPVGTHNKKRATHVPVTIVKQGKAYPLKKIEEALQAYITANKVQPAPSTMTMKANPFAAALGEQEYPPSDPHKVAEHCNAIRQLRDDAENVSEPHWHRGIGVLKHCEGGEQVIHDWSKKYSGYSHEETQAKIDEWSVGPTSCAEMDKHIGCMASCPMAGKCATPIQLGTTEDARSVEKEAPQTSTPTQQPAQIINGQNIPYWPQSGYRWDGSVLSRAITDKETGVVTWRSFCKSFIYPLNRIQDSEGTWVILWKAQEKNGKWREFYMPTMELASTDMMARTFAAHEVFLAKNKTARNDMSEFAEGLIETLQAWKIETKTYVQFGWNTDYTGFIIGTNMITSKDEKEVLCDSSIPQDITVDFGTRGTLDEWIDNIDKLYNRAGAEPFQFALCHSMGSALVQLMGSSNWHGLPLAFTGHGGTGKSTAAKIACGFYGNPSLMERQTGEQGSTLNAAIKRIAIMGSVPMLLDEFSGRSPDELTRTGYALANGRDKERLGTNGRFSTVGGQWFKNSFITSNDSIHESISKLPAGYRVEATQLRFFEVPLPEDYRHRVFADIDQKFVEHHMDHVYGEACRPFLRFIIDNHDWVKRQLQTARAKFNPKSDDDNKERFYRDTIVTAWVAGKIARKLGLVTFDVNAMKEWAVDQVGKMRDSRKESNVDILEQIARFIGTLPGRLIITKSFGDARSKSKEHPQEILRAPAVGRVCTEDKKVYINVTAVNEFCKDQNIPPSVMRDELDNLGYLVRTHDGSPSHKIYIGAGTTYPSGQTRCYEFKYHKLFDGKALSIVEDGKGVHTEATGS